MVPEELKKNINKWVSFTQIGDSGRERGTVKHGKLLEILYGRQKYIVCCFKSVENSDAIDGFGWRERPKEFDRSWLMYNDGMNTFCYKNLKLNKVLGEL